MNQDVSTRVQIALEQIGEDESLTGDLTDPAATALIEWMAQQIRAADAAPDDETFRQRVAAIRSAARAAANTAADEDVGAALVVERAQMALQDQEPGSKNQEPRTKNQEPDSLAVESSLEARRSSVWTSLRRRVRRWVHRKV